MKPFRVLHLSDIHIGKTYMESENLAYKIITDIENENLQEIQCVIVTGDIFEGNLGYKKEIINEAKKFFNIIFDELNKSFYIGKEDFLFVPGNHDIVRTEDTIERWKKYRDFLEEFYGTIPDFYDLEDFSLVKIYDDRKIAFAGFNSCGLMEEKFTDNNIIKNIEVIDEDQFIDAGINKQNLLKLLDQNTNKTKFVDFGEIQQKQMLKISRSLIKCDDYNIIAFFHHHFYLFPEVYTKYGDSSLIRNYTDIIQRMQKLGVKTVLHGHKHFDLERPLVTDSYYENANNIINIIAGGSVGTDRVTKHTFNIIDFFDKENHIDLLQRKFTYNNDQLEPITLKQIPPQSNETNKSIRLLKTLEYNNPELYQKYINAIDRINIAADDYKNMVNWLENVFVGFNEVFKIFDKDSLCVFFLLFAMNYRVLKLKQTLGKVTINESYFSILNELIKDEGITVNFDKDKYIKVFEYSELAELKDNCDEILNTLTSKKSKYYLSFSMIGIFITDIYMILRYYSGSFYNRRIKYKVNINLDETEFHQNVPVQRIMIHSDADRRSAFIDLKCNTATAHKLAVLFVKEFELIISKYEDYFKIVGLKLYYLTPKIEKSDVPNAIDNYNFEAYIPKLIPLLTGDNIYSKKEVFSRELIQNSIDAIAVRESTGADFDTKIYITLGKIGGRKYFKIKDFGTGMDRFKIERYFTSIGRSFYSDDEYKDLDLEYKPISNFGIGFLSAFMICREIDVKTRYYQDEEEGIKLHIPNYDGCFFIEKDTDIEIGTEITLYIDEKISHNITFDKITDYICETMQDIKYDIVINNEFENKEIIIDSKRLRKEVDNKQLLYIPFLENGGIVNNINVEDTIWSNNFIELYKYGLLINLNGWNKNISSALNSGIRLNDTNADNILDLLSVNTSLAHHLSFNRYFSFNFPSNYLNIDVSREKVTDFASRCLENNFSVKLLGEIYQQILQYIDLVKDIETNVRSINLYVLINGLANICKSNDTLSKLREKIMSTRYILFMRKDSQQLEFIVSKSCDKPENSLSYSRNNYSKFCKELKLFVVGCLSNDNLDDYVLIKNYIHKKLFKLLPRFERNNYYYFESDDEYFYNYHFLEKDPQLIRINESLQRKLSCKDDNMVYILLLLVSINTHIENDNSYNTLLNTVIIGILERCTISEIENKKGIITIKNSDLQKVFNRIKDNIESEKLLLEM